MTVYRPEDNVQWCSHRVQCGAEEGLHSLWLDSIDLVIGALGGEGRAANMTQLGEARSAACLARKGFVGIEAPT